MFLSPALAADTTMVTSPDGHIGFRLFLHHDTLCYAVSFRDIPVIKPSPMVFSIDGTTLTAGVQPGSVKRYTVNETYPWRGAHAVAVNHCNGAMVSIRQAKMPFTLDIRVFDDGIAFRTIAPGAAVASRIPDEATLFNIADGSMLWYHDLVMHYEGVYAEKKISSLADSEWVAPPATFKLPQGIYASITEADLRDYAGMALQANGSGGLVLRLAQHQPASYPYKLRYSAEEVARSLEPASVTGTIRTPWRVVMIGADLNTMVNNDIVHDLCPPPDPKLFPQGLHTSWIRPGRAVWKYLDGGGPGTPEVMKQFSEEASELGFEHNILEGFWARWTDDQIREVVNYSRQRQVGIWVWKHSKSLRDATARDAFFKRCHDLGITGIKIDFFDSEAKEVIDLYEAIHREAARYHLLLDFHGADKPTGQSRTWPNELTREAVKGMESSKLIDRATHETTLPFTRCLAGPAEYTVMHFGDRRQNTTWTHQIASAAILSAPLLTYSANPANILANPAVNLIKRIPSTWDETIVLPGSEIGKLAAFARRKGGTWFIAVMNGTTPQKLTIPLRFLKSGSHATTIAEDDPANPAFLEMKNASYTSKDVLTLSLEAGGGWIGMFAESR